MTQSKGTPHQKPISVYDVPEFAVHLLKVISDQVQISVARFADIESSFGLQ